MFTQNLHTNIHSSLIHYRHKVYTTQMSINWWINKSKLVNLSIKYYLAMRRNGVLMHATTWMTLKNIVLDEMNQTQKTFYVIPLTWKFRLGQSVEIENRLGAVVVGRRKDWGTESRYLANIVKWMSECRNKCCWLLWQRIDQGIGLSHLAQFSSVQSLSHVRLFVTTWTAACQARWWTGMSITNSRSPPKPISIESVMPSNHLIFCHPLLLLPSIFSSIRVFSN